jgi:hypothetical protein
MPTTVLRTVPRLATQDGKPVARRAPGRTTNAGSGRTREYLIPGEVDRLVAVAKKRGRLRQGAAHSRRDHAPRPRPADRYDRRRAALLARCLDYRSDPVFAGRADPNPMHFPAAAQ